MIYGLMIGWFFGVMAGGWFVHRVYVGGEFWRRKRGTGLRGRACRSSPRH